MKATKIASAAMFGVTGLVYLAGLPFVLISGVLPLTWGRLRKTLLYCKCRNPQSIIAKRRRPAFGRTGSGPIEQSDLMEDDMGFEDLTAEQREMARGKSPEEIFELAKKLGRTLTDEEVEQIAGGDEKWHGAPCPKYGSNDTDTTPGASPKSNVCHACGYAWLP